MPWLRLGDNSATYPQVMALAGVTRADERTQNEVLGFVLRLATQSSSHMTDYRVDIGTAQLFGGSRTALLLRQAVAAGLLVAHGAGQSRSWTIVEDPEFIHMPSKAEVMWRRQRDRDRKNESLTVPVRARDGDECRYCGRIVNWADRKGIKGGQYDHVDPGEAARVETLVVSCGGCNREFGDVDGDVKRTKLMPAPLAPFFSTHSAAWLTKRGVPTEPTPAQSGSEHAGAAGAESTSASPTATARPRSRNHDAHARPAATAAGTAAPARDESTDPSTAATVRDSAPETPQPPPARATPWAATAATSARPDFLSDHAATSDARPATHPADTAHLERVGNAPPGAPGSVGNQLVPDRSDVWNPGRVGSGQAGTGAAGTRPGAVSCPPDLSGSRPHSSPGRRGKRGRRSKKG